MQSAFAGPGELQQRLYGFYGSALAALLKANSPFLVGGAYALAHYTGVVRHTKDLDLFVRPHDFGAHWRVLLSHLILFGFIYPAERARIPTWVMQELLNRLQHDPQSHPSAARICQGTLLSRAEYLIDIEQWEYEDARVLPRGPMTAEEIAQWTAAIDQEK
jgi:hypothetical protein